MIAYRILGWDEHFENNKSRERASCSFVCVPNKQHGLGFRLVWREADGAAIFGNWCALTQVISRQNKPRLGWVTDTGRDPFGEKPGIPLSAEDLSVIWGGSPASIQRMLDFMSSVRVGWLEACDKVPVWCPSGARLVPVWCPPSAPELKRIEEKGKEGKGREANPTAAPAPEDLFDGKPAYPNGHDLRIKTLPDLELICPGIHIGRDERQTWETLLRGYTWEPMVEACKASHDPKTNRIYLSAVKTYLAENFRITEESNHGR